jgi:hypothetical protein
MEIARCACARVYSYRKKMRAAGPAIRPHINKHSSPMSTPRYVHSTSLAASWRCPFPRWRALIYPLRYPLAWPPPLAWPLASAWPSPSLFWRRSRVGPSCSSTGLSSFCEPRQRYAGASAQMKGSLGDGVGRLRWEEGFSASSQPEAPDTDLFDVAVAQDRLGH